MPSPIGNSPGFNDFAQIARLRNSDSKEVTLGDTLKGEAAVQTRGRFFSRLVEIFRPSVARAQHQASAEAFVAAIEKHLAAPHASNSPFVNAELISGDRRELLLNNLRGQLADQLQGQARLTGSDVKAALDWLRTEVRFEVHLEMANTLGEALSNLEASAADQDDLSVRQAIDHYDDSVALTSEDKESVKAFVELYADTKGLMKELFDAESGSYNGLKETMMDKKRKATSEGREAEAAGWGELLQWCGDQHRELSSRLTELKSVADKANNIQQAIDGPQRNHAPLQQPAQTGSAGRGILKHTEASPVDPNAKWVDDGTDNDVEMPEEVRESGAAKQSRLARSRDELASVSERSEAFKVSFAEGRQVRNIPGRSEAAELEQAPSAPPGDQV